MTRRPADRVSLGVAALRRLTAEDGPVATITRARLLARVHGRRRQRRLAFALGLIVLAVASGTLAATILLQRAHEVPPTSLPAAAQPVGKAIVPSRISVAAGPAPILPSAVSDSDGELQAYGAAHAAHFVRKDPRGALRLWTAYLRRFPNGRFVPEATYNRALALVRLGRGKQAIAALKPIAAGRFGDYRRQEAEALIGALAATRSSNM